MSNVPFDPFGIGQALYDGSQSFLPKDDKSDRFVNGVFTPFPWETGATEFASWISWMQFINNKLQNSSSSIQVRNETGSTLPAVPVKILSYDNTNSAFTVAQADATGDNPAVLVLTAPLANNTTGTAVYAGTVTSSTLNTALATLGDPVFLAIGGGYTLTDPSSTTDTIRQVVGYVKSLAVNGDIQAYINAPVRVGKSFVNLAVGDLNNVGPQAPTNGQVLTWDSATSQYYPNGTGGAGYQGPIGTQGTSGPAGVQGVVGGDGPSGTSTPQAIGCQTSGPQQQSTGSFQDILFGIENYKVGTAITHSTSIVTEKFIIAQTGSYQCTYKVWITDYFGYFESQVTLNGTQIAGSYSNSDLARGHGGDSANAYIHHTFVFAASNGDTLRLQANENYALDGFQAEIVFTQIAGGQGVQGVAGSNGNGVQGPQGFTGAGVQGATGVQGFNGPQGITGTAGTQGPKGTQGFTGLQGVDGHQGFDGHQGPQGYTGPKGDTGDIGPFGQQGPIGPSSPLIKPRL